MTLTEAQAMTTLGEIVARYVFYNAPWRSLSPRDQLNAQRAAEAVVEEMMQRDAEFMRERQKGVKL